MATTKDPVRVAVTGAAGQIGYASSSASPAASMLGPDQPVILQMLEITPALDALRGRGHGARGLRLPAAARGMVQTDDPDDGLRRRRRRPPRRRHAPQGGHGALRPARAPTAASSSRRARRCRRSAQRDVKVLVVGNPANTNALIAQQNAKDLDPSPLHGDDPARPQPGRSPSWPPRPAPHSTDVTRHDDLGQPLGHAVPRRVPRRGGGQARLRRRRQGPGLARGRLHPHGPAARRRHHQGPRACPRRRRRPTPPSTTSARGCSAPPRATGCRWASSATAATARPRGSSRASRAPAKDGEYQIVQGLDIDDFSRERIDKSNAELVEERDAVQELGLI